MNHDDLVERAARWLAGSKKCSIVITEMGSAASEIPDAIGWNGAHSTLVECKTSKSDFKNDKWKIGRRDPKYGMGNKRYYLVPPELVDFAIENRADGWGVLKAMKKSCWARHPSQAFQDVAKNREMLLLISSIRRIAMKRNPLKGLNVKCYTFGDTEKARATLGINNSEQGQLFKEEF